MNVDEALRRFAEDDRLPREAMAWALANWETASPRFISRLRTFAAGGDRTEGAADEILVILHLCGQMREARAYEPLCRWIADDPDLELWLGDVITETLPGILINVFDGDTVPLRRAIESARGDDFARASALAALGYLVRAKGAMSDADMREYLRRIRRDAAPRRESVLWMTWAATVANLGYDDMRAEVAELRSEGFIPEGDFDRQAFDSRIAIARSDASGLKGFADDFIAPLDDAASALLLLGGAEAARDARRLCALVELKVGRPN